MSYGKEIGPCDFYEDGQVFVVDEDNSSCFRSSGLTRRTKGGT